MTDDEKQEMTRLRDECEDLRELARASLMILATLLVVLGTLGLAAILNAVLK